MLENYLQELREALISTGASDIELVVEEYRTKFNNITAIGKSPFEAVLALGDPMEIAARIKGLDYSAEDKLMSNMLSGCDTVASPTSSATGDSIDTICADSNNSVGINTAQKSGGKPAKVEKPSTMFGIIATDILYITPAILLSVAGLIALAFMGGLSGFIGVCYSIMSWTAFNTMTQKICGFVLSILAILMFVGAMAIIILSIKKMISGLKNYAQERGEKVKIAKEISNEKSS